MKKLHLAAIASCLAATSMLAQIPGGCAFESPPDEVIVYDSAWKQQTPSPVCGDLSSFIKSTNLTFNINFHFFRPTITSPNFNTSKDYYKNVTAAQVDTMVKYMNRRMANLHPPDKTTNPPVSNNYSDSKIRFNLTGVYTHINDTAWTKGIAYSNWAYNRYAANPASEINIFFLADDSMSGGGYGKYGYIIMSCFTWNYNNWCETCANQTDIGTMVHELGHTVGLLDHTNMQGFKVNVPTGYYYPSVTRDFYHESIGSCWGNVPSVSQGGCASNNIMGYNNDRTYLSPNQIGSYFYGVYAGITSRFTSQPQPPNYCVYDSTKTITISKDTSWNNCNTPLI